MTRATAIRFAAMSAVLIFGLADGLALFAGIPFPPIQWAGVVVGVTVLTWWRELAQ
jgi:hypothetical protein